MQRLGNIPDGKLVFRPTGAPMSISSECLNHGIILPPGKALLETGLFTLGYLRTDQGRDIEVALRKSDSFAIHLVTNNTLGTADSLPIRLYPNPEPND